MASLALALAAVLAAAFPTPGLYAALGLGLAAIGIGWVRFRRRGDPGFSRLAGAGAMALGGLAVALAALRVALALAAIGHLDRLVG